MLLNKDGIMLFRYESFVSPSSYTHDIKTYETRKTIVINSFSDNMDIVTHCYLFDFNAAMDDLQSSSLII